MGPIWVVVFGVLLIVSAVGATGSASGAAPPRAPDSHGHGAPSAAPAAPAMRSSATASGIRSPGATSTTAASILSEIQAHHVPLRDAYLPNLNAPQVPMQGGLVSPLYSFAPAPMGIGDFGIEKNNTTGVNQAVTNKTPSLEGVASFQSLNALYVDSTSPDDLSVQMNAVLNGVNLFGTSTYDFWNQNVVTYSTQHHQLTFLDNVWNFSSPAFDMTSNALYSHGPNGTVVPHVFYYAVGPTLTVRTPFTLALFLNSTVVSGRDAVYFNYSVTQTGGGTLAGSYDEVVFNSTGPTSSPYYLISGSKLTPTGLLNDAELVLGGPGGGSTVSITNINATMQLYLQSLPPGTGYAPVGSAYGFGSDTGETSEGVSVWSNLVGGVPTADLNTGPSFANKQFSLWGVAGSRFGYQGLNLSVTPSNAFVFVSQGGSYVASASAWVPTSSSGFPVTIGATNTTLKGMLHLYPGFNYSFRVMLSDYTLQNFTVGPSNSSLNVNLKYRPSQGLYTPLWATGNAELLNISMPGSGSGGTPYKLFNNENGSLDPSFGEVNDFLFPVFPGVFLNGTTASVLLNDSAPFFLAYPSNYAYELQQVGLPVYNYLQLQFFDSGNVTIWRSPLIAGWFSSYLNGFVVASVMFWNSSNDLVGRNRFVDQGASLLFYGGTANTAWNNTFIASTPTTTSTGNLYHESDQVGFVSGGAGYLIYNNNFSVPAPALVLNFDLYSGAPTGYSDTWNVTREAATQTRTVNGETLSGNILGLNYQGGNFWINYGQPGNPFGVLPYNDSGRIYTGGDYLPLVPYTLYTVTFTESDLAAGTAWSVNLSGVLRTSSTSSISFLDPNGQYVFVVPSVGGYPAPVPTSDVLYVSGQNVTRAIAFGTPGAYSVVFTESGLAPGVPWNVTLGSITQVSYGSTIGFPSESNGTYAFSVGAPSYAAIPASGSLTVAGASVSRPISFTIVPGTLSGTVAPTTATLSVDGSPVTTSAGNFSISIAPGVHAVEATASGYDPYFNNVTVHSSSTTRIAIGLNLHAATPPSAPGNISARVSPASASVSIAGLNIPLTSGSFRIQERPGLYAIVVTAPGYYTYYNNITVTPGNTTALSIALNPTKATAVQFLSSPTFYGILGAGIAIAIGVVIAALVLSRKKPKAPPAEYHPPDDRTDELQPGSEPAT
jgi:thermopsin